MNSFLNLILIAIVCGFANSVPTTSKTIPSNNTIFSVSTSNSEKSSANLSQELNNYYMTTLVKNVFSTTLKVPVTQSVKLGNCSGTKTVSTKVYDLCSTIDNVVKTPCDQTTTRLFITSFSCSFSTEYLAKPIPVTTTQCTNIATPCKTKTIYSTSYSTIRSKTITQSLRPKTLTYGNYIQNSEPTKVIKVVYPTIYSYCVESKSIYDCAIPDTNIETDIETDIVTLPPKTTTTTTTKTVEKTITTDNETDFETDIVTLPPKTTTTTTTKTVEKTNTTTTTTTTPAVTYCTPETLTFTEKETITDVEEETVTVTIKIPKPTDNEIDDSKCGATSGAVECGAAALGYPCCQSTCTEVYTDEYRWGVENGDWCGLKDSC